MKYLLISVGIIVVVFLVLVLVGKKSVRSEVLVDAPIGDVWKVITTPAEYDEWNTVINSVKGKMQEGQEVNFTFHQGEGKSYPIKATVKKVEEQKLVNQFGGMTGIMTFNHKFILEESGNQTKLVIHEEYRGAMVPFWNAEPVGAAYDKLVGEIKARAESISKN